MKRLLLPALVLASSVARGGVAETQVLSAFTDLRSQPSYSITLTGSDTIDGKTKTFSATLWWQSTSDASGNSVYKLSCDEKVNGALAYRTVGNGTVMFSLDVWRNTYTATTYGSYGTTAPTGYLRAAVMAFSAGAKGSTMYLARLLTDVYAGPAAQYTPWLHSTVPGEPTEVLVGDGYVSYRFGNPVYRWMRYTLWPDGYGNYVLSSFDMTDGTPLAGKPRTISWVATLNKTAEPPAGTFEFTPPPGSHAIGQNVRASK